MVTDGCSKNKKKTKCDICQNVDLWDIFYERNIGMKRSEMRIDYGLNK
jgi:hypothetical protein